jgi:hypothetical protein
MDLDEGRVEVVEVERVVNYTRGLLSGNLAEIDCAVNSTTHGCDLLTSRGQELQKAKIEQASLYSQRLNIATLSSKKTPSL